MNIRTHNRLMILISFCLFILLNIQGRTQIFQRGYDSLLLHFADTLFSAISIENVIYAGIDNKIIFRKECFEDEYISLSSENASIVSEDTSFIIRVDKAAAPEVTLILSNRDFKHQVCKRFGIKGLPVPHVFIGHTNISETQVLQKADIQSADSTYLFYGNTIANNCDWLRIKRFSIGYNYGNYYISNDNEGNRIGSKVRSILYGLKPGQEVSLTIVVEGLGQIEKVISTIHFKVY